MANNAIKILQDDTTLARFKTQAYQQAQKFSIEKIIPMYEELYMQVIEKNKN